MIQLIPYISKYVQNHLNSLISSIFNILKKCLLMMFEVISCNPPHSY